MYKTIFTALASLFVFAPPGNAQPPADPYASLNCVQLADSIVALLEGADMTSPADLVEHYKTEDCTPDFRRGIRNFLEEVKREIHAPLAFDEYLKTEEPRHANPLNCVQLSDSIVALSERHGVDIDTSNSYKHGDAVARLMHEDCPQHLRGLLRTMLATVAEGIRLRNPLEPTVPAPVARPETASTCTIAVFKTSDTFGIVTVEGVMETWRPGDWLYAQLYDDNKWLGNGITVIQPGGGFNFSVLNAPMPAKAQMKYRCAPMQ